MLLALILHSAGVLGVDAQFLASPSFAAWGEGAPLDIESLLWGPDSRPNAAVVYLAHLSDSERQMVVTRVLSKLVAWMRESRRSENVRNGDHLLKMDGRAVWDCGVREVPAVIHEALEAAGKTVKDVDFVVSHQANKRLLFEILDRAGLKGCRTYTNVERYGNTVAASALIALDEVARQELVKPGELVLMCAIGAGMTWGAHVFRW